MVTRRGVMLAAAGSIAAGAATTYYAHDIEPHWIEISQHELPVRGLPDAWVGRSLVHMADLHIGERVDDGYLLRVMATVRALAPDLVLVTGDLIDSAVTLPSHAQRMIAEIPRGRVATLACLGNHDWGSHWRERICADRVAGVAGECGVSVLRNEAVELEGLRIVGVDDLWSGAFDVARVMAGSRQGEPTIVMCHNPDDVDQRGWGGFDGWILAGHTHGGQVRPPFLPPLTIPVRNKRYVAGAYELAGNRKLYIGRGVGHSLQLRFNARPEVAVFTLTAAPPLA